MNCTPTSLTSRRPSSPGGQEVEQAFLTRSLYPGTATTHIQTCAGTQGNINPENPQRNPEDATQ